MQVAWRQGSCHSSAVCIHYSIRGELLHPVLAGAASGPSRHVLLAHLCAQPGLVAGRGAFNGLGGRFTLLHVRAIACATPQHSAFVTCKLAHMLWLTPL